MRDEGWLLGLHCCYSCGALGDCNLNQKKKKIGEGIRSIVFRIIMGHRGERERGRERGIIPHIGH